MIHRCKNLVDHFILEEVEILLNLVDICNTIKKKQELKNNPQLMISDLELRAETKNKNVETRKRFERYLRKSKSVQ